MSCINKLILSEKKQRIANARYIEIQENEVDATKLVTTQVHARDRSRRSCSAYGSLEHPLLLRPHCVSILEKRKSRSYEFRRPCLHQTRLAFVSITSASIITVIMSP